ncbi:MAG: hypothetical protein MASP_00411 [Candidatus Methanolliviera sp. GoM_asphalt]|nr:MAG: hypothetical protein MASP_00411 [Candidatus Methanolliviera sp. GoM_asphalt]
MRERFSAKQTNVTIISEKKYIEIVKKSILDARKDLEIFICKDPFFSITLDPYQLKEEMPEVVKRMVSASNKVGVGPMAAVAGTIAWLAVEEMIKDGAKYALIDNGGDIAILNNEKYYVGIYAGESPISGRYAFEIDPREKILGICTSSGTVGHSISFGIADAVTVFSEDVSLADAAATAFGNMVEDDLEESLNNIKEALWKNEELSGTVVIKGERMAFLGDVPPIVSADVDEDLITKP